MARNVKWTRELRAFLYKRVMDSLGLRAEWSGSFSSFGGVAQIQSLCTQLANEFSARTRNTFTSDAVSNQLHWALTRQPEVNERLMRQFVLNKAAAVEAGLIDADSLRIWFAETTGDLRQ